MTFAPATSRRPAPLALRLGATWLIAMLVALPASKAFACRAYQSEELLFATPPKPPAGPGYSSIALATVDRRPTPNPVTLPAPDRRGWLVGVATPLKIIRGPRLPNDLPLYLAVITSCTGAHPSGLGYVVGQLMIDANGPYMILARQTLTSGAPVPVQAGGWLPGLPDSAPAVR